MRGLKEAGRGQDNSLGYGDWLVAFFVQRCCSGASADYIDLEPDYPDDAIVYRSNA